MFESILDGIGTIFTGGLGGIIGSVGSFFVKKSEHSHEIKMREMDLKEMQMESSLEIQKIETESQIATEIAASKSFSISQKLGNLITGIKWVDAVRGLMRPLITSSLLTVSFILTLNISRIIGGLEAIPINELMDIYKNIINQVFFLTNLCVSWWFGSRPTKK